MKDHLRSLTDAAGSTLVARQVAREYIQARILANLQRSGAMLPLAFQGGTALRFLFNIPRFSEDLDFALERPESAYDFRRLVETLHRELASEGYALQMKVDDSKTVHSAFLRFPGLLNELDLSPIASEVLAVKIEVDTRPPAGAGLATTLVRRHVLLNLQHHDRSSLLVGKLHAILHRPYIKGRDVFDLVWYLSDPTSPPPNLTMLNNALVQTDWPGETLTVASWRPAIHARLAGAEWDRVRRDVEPFLEPSVDPALLDRDVVLSLLSD